jgi:hypothetical protein
MHRPGREGFHEWFKFDNSPSQPGEQRVIDAQIFGQYIPRKRHEQFLFCWIWWNTEPAACAGNGLQ